MAGFDFAAARKDGVSDDQIVSYLKTNNIGGFDYDKALSDGVSPTQIVDYIAASDKPKQAADETSLLKAPLKGAANVLEGIGSTVRRAFDKDTGHSIEAVGAKVEPTNYRSGVEDIKQGDISLNSAARAGGEVAPDLAAGLLSAKAASAVAKLFGGKGKLAAALGGAAYGAARVWGNEADTAAQKTSGNPEADLTPTDMLRAGASTAAQAALSGIGLSRLAAPGRIAATGARGVAETLGQAGTTLGIEAATGMGQSVASQAAQTIGRPEGLNIDRNEVLAGGLTNAIGATPFVGGRAARESVQATRMRGFDAESSKSFASRIEQHAGDDNLGNTRVGKEAYDAAIKDVRTDLSTALSADDSASAGIKQNAEANRALERVRSGDRVSDADLAAIRDASKGTANADTISHLTRELATASALSKMGMMTEKGFKGGIAAQMERLRAIANPIGAVAGSAAGAAVGTGAIPLTSGFISMAPHTLAALGGIYAGARLTDRVTGMRSPAKSFVDKFGGSPDSVRSPVHVQEDPNDRFKTNTPEQVIDNGILKAVRAAQKAKQKTVLADSEEQLRGIQGDLRQQASMERAGNVLDSGMASAADRVIRQRDVEAERTARAAERAQERAERAKDRAEREAEREQIKDAMDQMSARRSHDTIARRGDAEQARDASNLMLSRRAMEKVTKQQAERRGAAIADRLARTSPHVQENGGELAGTPGFAKRAKEHLGGADAYKRLTQAPAEDNAVEKTVKASRAQEKMNGKAKEPARLTPDDSVGVQGTQQAFKFELNGKDGLLVVEPTEGGKHLDVKWVGSRDGEAYGNSNALGSKLKGLLNELKDKFPEAESIGGARFSGARAAAGATDKPARVSLNQRASSEAATEQVVQAARAQKKANGEAPKAEAPFELPTADHAYMDHAEAAEHLYKKAKEAGVDIRHPDRWKAHTARRIAGEEAAYMAISNRMDGEARQAFHPYLEGIKGADTQSVAKLVREHAKKAFPKYSKVIDEHLSDADIARLWKQ